MAREGGCGQPGLGRPWLQLAGGKTKYKTIECKDKTEICM
jgi:hypothetical protein